MKNEKLNPRLEIEHKPIGRSRKVSLIARMPDGTTFTDDVNVTNARVRAQFIKDLCKGRKGIDPAAVEVQLEQIAAQIGNAADGPDSPDGEKPRESQANLLVELAKDTKVFHTPGGHDSEGYATVKVNRHFETWPVNSRAFRRWLSHRFFLRFEKAPGSQVIQDALGVIAGHAIYDGPECQVHVRVAEHKDAIYLDLANDDWKVVKVTATGWHVLSSDAVPVRFLRKRGMLPLPTPVTGGSVDELRDLINVPGDDEWILLKALLVAYLRPGRPFPVGVVNGEQGSAKSTFCKMIRALIDPNVAPLRRPPKEERDLMIAAMNGWIVAYDNLSGIPTSLSDSLCTLATGGGFGTRELYSDDSEKLFDATRPVLINGIDDIVTRGDLLDRAITFTLPAIPDDQRRDEDELWTLFEELRPRLLGCLLDAVAEGLRGLGSVKLDRKPRMADFVKWVVAASPTLGSTVEEFLAAYERNRGVATAVAIESTPVGPAIGGLMHGKATWTGTVRELLVELEAHHSDEKARKQRDWPKSPRKLSADLRRLAPSLRRIGLNVEFGQHTEKGTSVRLEWVRKTPSVPSVPSASGVQKSQPDGPDGPDGVSPPDSCGIDSQTKEVMEWTA